MERVGDGGYTLVVVAHGDHCFLFRARIRAVGKALEEMIHTHTCTHSVH